MWKLFQTFNVNDWEDNQEHIFDNMRRIFLVQIFDDTNFSKEFINLYKMINEKFFFSINNDEPYYYPIYCINAFFEKGLSNISFKKTCNELNIFEYIMDNYVLNEKFNLERLEGEITYSYNLFNFEILDVYLAIISVLKELTNDDGNYINDRIYKEFHKKILKFKEESNDERSFILIQQMSYILVKFYNVNDKKLIKFDSDIIDFSLERLIKLINDGNQENYERSFNNCLSFFLYALSFDENCKIFYDRRYYFIDLFKDTVQDYKEFIINCIIHFLNEDLIIQYPDDRFFYLLYNLRFKTNSKIVQIKIKKTLIYKNTVCYHRILKDWQTLLETNTDKKLQTSLFI